MRRESGLRPHLLLFTEQLLCASCKWNIRVIFLEIGCRVIRILVSNRKKKNLN